MTKLALFPCDLDDDGVPTVRTSDKLEVAINPQKYQRDFKISYGQTAAEEGEPMGATSRYTKFSSYQQETVNFVLVFDATGVVSLVPPTIGIDGSNALSIEMPSVDEQIDELKSVVYDYVGNEHQPNVVHLQWANFTFYGRLASMSVDYTLFRQTGEAIRAKATLSFVSYMSPVEAAELANMTSPDLTHLVEVKAGDSLPLLCQQIYGSSAYYLDVAKANGLTNFRKIRPGTRLNFPPLR